MAIMKAILILILATSFAGSAAAIELPAAAGGSIDGKVALLFWPMVGNDLVEPRGCVVNVAADRGLGPVSRFRCGEWFVPGPADAYLTWLEQGYTISAAPTIVRYAAEPFRSAGVRSVVHMVPAGSVALATPPPRGAMTLRLFAGSRAGGLNPFDRRIPVSELANPVLVPAGPLIAALYDDGDRPVAIAREVQVEKGKRVDLAMAAPSSGGALIFSLQRPSGSYPPATIRLRQGDRARVPDVIHESSARVVAVWYSIPAGEASLQFEGSGLPQKAAAVHLQEGEIAIVRDKVTR